MPYKVRIKIPMPHVMGGESRKMTEVERKAWLANQVTSKYNPHQNTRETTRRERHSLSGLF